MGDSNCSVSLSSLLCQENETCLYEIEEEVEELEEKFYCIDDMGLSETEEEYIEMLISRERSYTSGSNGCSSEDCFTENWLRCAYLDAVQWILKMRAVFGFSFHTSYLSVTYLYQFLLRCEVDNRKSWAIRLLSVACLSLAVKMEECKIPALSEFCVDGYNFENQVIQQMELLILNTLEWRMSFVTPFAYLNYFITKFCNEFTSKSLLSKATRLISDTIKVMSLMNYRPSTIAAAAVLVSSDQRLTKRSLDFKMRVISSCGCLENDHVFACCNLMVELEKSKMKITNVIISPDLSSISGTDADSFAAVSSKRRRLAFNENDGDGHTSDQKQIC